MEFVDPVGRVGDHEVAHADRVRPVEVERRAPLVLVAVREVVVRILGKEIPGRAEVVVDDVENDAESQGVGAIDESAQVVGRAVEPRRGEQVHPVVAPAILASEIGHRHHLDRGDPDTFEER